MTFQKVEKCRLCLKGAFFMFIYDLSIFLTNTAFVSTNAKYGIPLSRYTVFLQNCPLGYDPNESHFLLFLNLGPTVGIDIVLDIDVSVVLFNCRRIVFIGSFTTVIGVTAATAATAEDAREHIARGHTRRGYNKNK